MIKIHSWQQKQWSYLVKRKNDNKLPNALLLSGFGSTQKVDFAKAFANFLLCENPVSQRACGECRSCKMFEVGVYTNLMLVQSEDKSSNIKIEQIRDLISFVTKTAHSIGYKVVIIENADELNIASSNALLKILEDTPSNTIIILITSRIALLPKTIVSRCQRIEFTFEDSKESESLKEEHLQLLENFINFVTSKINFTEFASFYLSLDAKIFLMRVGLLLKDIAKVKLGVVLSFVSYLRQIEFQKICKKINLDNLFCCYDEVTKLSKFQSNNLNKELLVEDVAILLREMLEEK